MATFIDLCFTWPMYLAFGLITLIALWDTIYGEHKLHFLMYPEHPWVQMLSYICCVLIFILWQLSPELTFLDNNIPALIFRLLALGVWYLLSRIIIYMLILGFAYYLHWSILDKLP